MNQIIMILLISALILVHEIGHFIAARMCGVKVSRFGIGMPLGPSWKLFCWKGTNFYLHAFLFGGYVAFPDDIEQFVDKKDDKKEEQKEQKPSKYAIINKLREILKNHAIKAEQKRKKEEEDFKKEMSIDKDSPERFDNKTIGQKFFIVSAGVLMNIIFAYVLVIGAALYYGKLPTQHQNIYVKEVVPDKISNIKDFDFKSGDKIEKINDYKIEMLYQLFLLSENSKLFDGYAQENLIDKNLKELKKLNPNIQEKIPAKTVINLPSAIAENPLKLDNKVLNALASYKKEGLKLSKEQIALRNDIYGEKQFIPQEDITLNDLAAALSDTYKPLKITILREGKEYTFDNIYLGPKGLFSVLKVKSQDIYTEIKTIKKAIVESNKYTVSKTFEILFTLWNLISGKVNVSDMHGVIAIVKVGGDIITSKGMLNGILLTAMISINLAIMNFLPIPALDGGHVLFLVIEKITGRKPTKEFAEKINSFFFILLIILMVAICYNDIFALVTKKL